MPYLKIIGQFIIKKQVGAHYAKGGLLMPLQNIAMDILTAFNNPKLTY